MRKIHIVGRKNSGKTSCTVDIVKELIKTGYKIGTIKHTAHSHELDSPGKDSHQHRLAGAIPAAIVAKNLTAIFFPTDPGINHYQKLAQNFNGCDLVIVEGDLECDGIKLEVWREDIGAPPLATERGDITALITDDDLETDLPVWGRSDVHLLAEKILGIRNLVDS